MPRIMIVPLLFGCLLCTAPAMADGIGSGESAPDPQDQAFTALQTENVNLSKKVADLEAVPSITEDALALKSRQRLREIAADVKSQRQSMA